MSELTEDQKLVKLGLRSPNQSVSVGTELIVQLRNTIAEDYATFQELFEDANLSSWADFESWLTNNGFDATTAANIRTNLESKYASFSEFKTTVLDELDSFEDFENEYSSGSGLRSDRTTEDGISASGIKVYEEAGVGRSGQSIPAGGVEVYGSEVHFSQSTAVQDTKDESAGTQDPIVWSNLSVSPNSADVGDTVRAEADVTNNTTQVAGVTAELLVDGTVKKRSVVSITATSTVTVGFDYDAGVDGTGTFDIGVSKAGTQEITVQYSGL